MNKIITNTSPIIALSIIGKLNLLWELFEEVYVPKSVCNEIFSGYKNNDFGKSELKNAIDHGKITVYEVKDEIFVNKLKGKLHIGELETIVGGLELDVDFVLIDERAARNQANNFMLSPIGTLGILRIAKSKEIILEIKPYLDILINNGFRLSKQVYNSILSAAHEL